MSDNETCPQCGCKDTFLFGDTPGNQILICRVCDKDLVLTEAAKGAA